MSQMAMLPLHRKEKIPLPMANKSVTAVYEQNPGKPFVDCIIRCLMMVPLKLRRHLLPYLEIAGCLAAIGLGIPAAAQNTAQPLATGVAAKQPDPVSDPQSTPIRGTRDKWNNFVHETASPLTLGAGTFNAAFSQATDTDPRYGVGTLAFADRFGASVADIASQNFFGDFVVASVFHEDPRYFRMGPGRHFWSRFGYALSRAVVIRKDSGGDAFNFDNVLGSALSTGFSNLYYPAPSRTGKGMLMHFGIDVGDNGFVNMAPEFWPDFRDKILRRHH
jgi:hypothetical protein